MTEYGAMGQGILALETLLEHQKDNLKIISYDSLCNKPKETITELYDFLNIPLYKHKFKNFSQVDTSGVKPSIIRTNKETIISAVSIVDSDSMIIFPKPLSAPINSPTMTPINENETAGVREANTQDIVDGITTVIVICKSEAPISFAALI